VRTLTEACDSPAWYNSSMVLGPDFRLDGLHGRGARYWRST
jgi:hypothetical protein